MNIRNHVLEILPEFEHFERRTEPDSYGATHIITQKLGLSEPLKSDAAWTHGWKFVPIKYPEQLAQQSSPDRRCLVPKAEHAEMMKNEFGYSDTHAVGAPFIYAPDPKVERVGNSLLVVPPHTLPYIENSWNERDYAEAIASISHNFDHVLVCVHRHDISDGNWTGEFDRVGIHWIPGTRVRDKHGLERMRILFSLFEYVTTNSLGSHIAYSAYCGSKPSIFGPFDARYIEEYEDDPVWGSGRNRKILEYKMQYYKERITRKRYPFLFKNPSNAKKHVEWGEQELGHDERVSFERLSELLWPDYEII